MLNLKTFPLHSWSGPCRHSGFDLAAYDIITGRLRVFVSAGDSARRALVTVHDDDGDDDMRWRKCIMALVIVPDDDT